MYPLPITASTGPVPRKHENEYPVKLYSHLKGINSHLSDFSFFKAGGSFNESDWGREKSDTKTYPRAVQQLKSLPHTLWQPCDLISKARAGKNLILVAIEPANEKKNVT